MSSSETSTLHLLPVFLASALLIRAVLQMRRADREIAEHRARMRASSSWSGTEPRVRTSSDKEEKIISRTPQRRCTSEGGIQGNQSLLEIAKPDSLQPLHPLSPIRGSGKSLGMKVAEQKSLDDSDFNFLTPVSSSFRLAAPIVDRIQHNKDIIVIGIAGGSGSGKTTLARAIYDTIGADNITLLSHDSYYNDLGHLPLSEREKQNFDHPNALDTDLLVEHVKALKEKRDVEVPTYDYNTHTRQRDQWRTLSPRPVIMVEGILIFCKPELFNLIDIKIFVDTDDDIRLIRRVQRDTIERGRALDGIIKQYVDTVRPMHLTFVEPSKRNADLIVPVGLNSVALDLVVSKLKSHLSEQATFGI